jgi:two-component system, cell cycle response regulator
MAGTGLLNSTPEANNASPRDDDAGLALDEAWRLGCTGRSKEAFALAAAVFHGSSDIDTQPNRARAALDMAWYCFQLGNTETGLNYAREAETRWREIGERAQEANALAIRAWLLQEIGRFEDAIDTAASALNLADSSGDARSRSLAINVIGVIFWLSHQPEQAIDYCSRAVALAREAGDRAFECWWLINLGGAWAEAAYAAVETGDNPAASHLVNKALEYTAISHSLAMELQDIWAQRLCLGNMAEYSNIAHDYDAAEQYLIRYQSVIGDDSDRGKGHFLLELTRSLISLGRYDEALAPIQEALELGRTSSQAETTMLANKHLSDAYEGLGDYKAALAAYKKYHTIQLQFSGEKIQQQARIAEIRYETDKLRALLDIEVKRSQDIASSYQELQRRTEMLAEAANLDPLTGLFNRRRLETLLSEFDENSQPFAIAMVDIDHFKKINDTCSHMIGDKVLRQVSIVMGERARQTDTIVRFGGEEFAILMHGTDMPTADAFCERLRSLIAAWPWAQIAKGLGVTVSIGIATHCEAADARTALQIADQRLFAAKRLGRNRVVASGE